jgi:hypothetical protein
MQLPSPQLVYPPPHLRRSPPGGRSGPRPARTTTRPAGPKSERVMCAQRGATSLSPSHQPGQRPAHAPSTARQSAPGSDPDPSPRLRHWPTRQYPMAVTARRLVSRHPSQYPEAHGPSVPHARLGGPCNVRPARLSPRAERPAAPPSETQRAGSDHPTAQHRGPSSRARPRALHRATASARVPTPTQARASATGGCGTGQHNRSDRRKTVLSNYRLFLH